MVMTVALVEEVLDRLVGDVERTVDTDGHNVSIFTHHTSRFDTELILRALGEASGGGPYTVGVMDPSHQLPPTAGVREPRRPLPITPSFAADPPQT